MPNSRLSVVQKKHSHCGLCFNNIIFAYLEDHFDSTEYDLWFSLGRTISVITTNHYFLFSTLNCQNHHLLTLVNICVFVEQIKTCSSLMHPKFTYNRCFVTLKKHSISRELSLYISLQGPSSLLLDK